MDSLKPPLCVGSLPKNLEANYQNFKATEYQVFLLFYEIPCVYSVLPEKNPNHFCNVVRSYSHILRSRYLCEKFYRQFTDLCGEENCGLNIYNTGDHLVNYVVHWRSLAEWPNFGYEDVNGYFEKVCQRIRWYYYRVNASETFDF